MAKVKLEALLAWRQQQVGATTPAQLARSLTVEGLAYEDIPLDLARAIVAYRHRNTNDRLALCRRWLAGRR